MKKNLTKLIREKTALFFLLFAFFTAKSQTNVYDDVIAVSPDHTTLKAALVQEGLDAVLRDNSAKFTVFAPTNTAFDSLAAKLGTNINGILALSNLSDILKYHVLGSEVIAADITNGDVVTPVFTGATLKLTKTSVGSNVFVNQAKVTSANITKDNGVVHVVDAVLLPDTTVVDIAINNGFTTLTAAVVKAELLPALTDPFSNLTVFAPTNAAFDSLASKLETDLDGILGLSNLADILTYHVLGTEVVSDSIKNGALVTPLFDKNTLKLTKKSDNSGVFVNQAQVTLADVDADNGIVHVVNAVLLPDTTVVDIAINNGFTTLTAALVKAELLPALTDPFSNLTVFAPTNAAFDSLASKLETDLDGILGLSNLADVLTYHVLGKEVVSDSIKNGALVTPLFDKNTLKLTKKSDNSGVFANQAQVTLADVDADNGIVHVVNAVLLPDTTVVDIAINNGFTTLTAAVVKAELLPALTDPFSNLTVFAPTNAAFDNLASRLGTDLNGILALSNLADVLTYHVLGTEVVSDSIKNGALVTPLFDKNTLKLTKKSDNSGVFVNQAQVTLADVDADNGIVHVVNAVLLPDTTVVDIAINNGFTTLTAAVVKAELLPALTDPFSNLTVFAPTNAAFDSLAAELGTDLDGVLNNPELNNILLYHVVSGKLESADLTDGPLVTLNGKSVNVNTSSGVKINESQVVLADVKASNGVAHVINKVLLPPPSIVLSIGEITDEDLLVKVFPNPSIDFITIFSTQSGSFQITDLNGRIIEAGDFEKTKTIDVKQFTSGTYLIKLLSENGVQYSKFIKL
jgi:uncharacterized surface protein with fasciclin (FAS1) repeats